jgi:D-serine deaminase-like pyridoxal phosphate-dependent protein
MKGVAVAGDFKVPHLPPAELYRFAGSDELMTPALIIYPDYVDANIRQTIAALGGNPDRWRPHVKTARLGFVMSRFVEHGITAFKCSTTLELLTVCEAGARDVLVAYPVIGPAASRVREIASMHKDAKVSVLVENIKQAENWAGGEIGLFIDINPGMDRTGIPQERIEEIARLAERIIEQGTEVRGLHFYDGHVAGASPEERQAKAHLGYDKLIEIVRYLESRNIAVREVITAGTPAFPCSVSYSGFADASFLHRASPGTVVYGDATSLGQLPDEYQYQPAAVVLSTVVSHPSATIITCDAGHKTVSADAGIPTCVVLDHPDLRPMKPSEEHLPIDAAGGEIPEIGERLFLVPRHVCPTVNNFDHAVIVSGGAIVGLERVTARGREAPLKAARGAR